MHPRQSTLKRQKKRAIGRSSWKNFVLSGPAAETRIFDIPRTHFLTYRGELFADIVGRSIGVPDVARFAKR